MRCTVLILSVLFPGCAADPRVIEYGPTYSRASDPSPSARREKVVKGYDSLTIKMSPQEVRAIMGPPDNVGPVNTFEYAGFQGLVYSYGLAPGEYISLYFGPLENRLQWAVPRGIPGLYERGSPRHLGR